MSFIVATCVVSQSFVGTVGFDGWGIVDVGRSLRIPNIPAALCGCTMAIEAIASPQQ